MTQTTRLTILQRIAPMLGGYQGNITSGTGTTIVAEGLVGAVSDDDLNDDLLAMPDAATAADQVRIISDTTGSTGTLTFATRSDTTYTSETYFTIPKNTFTLQECRQAVSRAVTGTKRTYRYVVPTRDHERHYHLADLSWLRNADDVDGVFYRPNPGLLSNDDFTHWHSGTTNAPDGWTLSGTSATIARSTTFASFGSYVVQLTSASADAELAQDVPYPLAKQLIDDLATIAVKVRARATAASEGRVGINDGNDTTWSDYHSGDGEPEDLTVSRTLTAAASRIRIILQTATGTNVVDFDRVVAVEGTAVDDATWDAVGAYRERDIDYQIHNVGSAVPVLVTAHEYPRKGQFVVVTRRPYADLTTDSASTEAPEDTIVAKTIYELALLDKPSMTRDRADRLLARYGTTFAKLARGLVDRPVQPTQTAVYVRGA